MSSIQPWILFWNFSSYFLSQVLVILYISTSSSDKKIIPSLLTVAGDAKRRSLVSKMKLILLPKLILSPFGKVRRWLSSSTEFRDSTHSGSISPSHTIQHIVSAGSLTTALALAVKTPS